MAIINGLFGNFSGSVGNYVGCRWKGGMYVRSRPKPNPNYKPSPAQQAQRRKFALGNQFLQPIAPLLKVSFQPDGSLKAPKNRALSHILKQAIIGTAPDFALDYSRILISQGDLPNAPEATVIATSNGQVQFTWKSTAGIGQASRSDKVVLVVHCPELNQSVYDPAAAKRSAEQVTIEAGAFAGKTIHTWMGFLTEDFRLAANSQYTGELMM